MTAASTKASGGTFAGSYSFSRLRNNIDFGTPYRSEQNTAESTRPMVAENSDTIAPGRDVALSEMVTSSESASTV
jgi:hypothetical protein